MSVESKKESRKWKTARTSPSLKSFLELLPPFCAGYRPIHRFVLPQRVEMCIFIVDDTFLRSCCSWTWNLARQTSRFHGSTTRALCKGLEILIVRNFDRALRATKSKLDNLFGTGEYMCLKHHLRCKFPIKSCASSSGRALTVILRPSTEPIPAPEGLCDFSKDTVKTMLTVTGDKHVALTRTVIL